MPSGGGPARQSGVQVWLNAPPADLADMQRWQAWLEAPVAEKEAAYFRYVTRGRHDGECALEVGDGH